MESMTNANGRIWDVLAASHYAHYDIPRLRQGQPLLNDLIRAEVGDVHGKSLMHLLCHIGTDTLSWALLGARVTGVDISAESLRYAQQLAEELHLDHRATFIQSDVMTLAAQSDYDIVFASTGVLCWIPDLWAFMRTVRQLLKPGGFFYMHEGHPFAWMLRKDEHSEASVISNYFHKGAEAYEDMGDYASPGLKVTGACYEWMWTLGDVVTACCDAGLRIAFLHEFPQFYYSGYTAYDVETNKVELYPCTFSLKAFV